MIVISIDIRAFCFAILESWWTWKDLKCVIYEEKYQIVMHCKKALHYSNKGINVKSRTQKFSLEAFIACKSTQSLFSKIQFKEKEKTCRLLIKKQRWWSPRSHPDDSSNFKPLIYRLAPLSYEHTKNTFPISDWIIILIWSYLQQKGEKIHPSFYLYISQNHFSLRKPIFTPHID